MGRSDTAATVRLAALLPPPPPLPPKTGVRLALRPKRKLLLPTVSTRIFNFEASDQQFQEVEAVMAAEDGLWAETLTACAFAKDKLIWWS